MTPKELLAELRSELLRGKISEAQLRDPDFHLDGYCDHGTKRVYVNPQPAVVETLLHELTHRRFPGWSEQRVLRESRKALSSLTDAEVTAWYRRYQRAARRHKQPKRIEAE